MGVRAAKDDSGARDQGPAEAGVDVNGADFQKAEVEVTAGGE